MCRPHVATDCPHNFGDQHRTGRREPFRSLPNQFYLPSRGSDAEQLTQRSAGSCPPACHHPPLPAKLIVLLSSHDFFKSPKTAHTNQLPEKSPAKSLCQLWDMRGLSLPSPESCVLPGYLVLSSAASWLHMEKVSVMGAVAGDWICTLTSKVLCHRNLLVVPDMCSHPSAHL